ncbi:MAG: PHP domain-containing protein [Candidatus Latescibacterota bacterium]|nr:MAG: PHP domain-containing protein [Candidatus Latescibacterota bacterium]
MERLSGAIGKPDLPKFTHVKVYSSYSLGVGLNTPEEICAHAKRSGFGSVALTDINSTYGFVEFHLAAKKHEIKPIYGVVLQHHPLVRAGEDRFSLALLATSRDGLRHVAALASLSTAAGEGGGALDLDMFGPHTDGVAAFMGAVDSEVANMLLAGDDAGAAKVVNTFRELFGERLFIEIQDHGVPEERVLTQKLLELASGTEVAPLLTQEVRYLDKGMRELYGTLRGIQQPGRGNDFFKIDREPADWSMKSALEISVLHPFYQAAYENTTRVDEMIPGDLLDDVDRDAAKSELFPSSDACREELLELCTRAVRNRYGSLSNTEILRYQTMLEDEVDQILSENLGPTFLLFHRILTRLRESRIELGPATALNLQSLTAYLLGITSFDPYRYKPNFQPAFDSRSRESREIEIQITSDSRSEVMQLLFEMFEFGSLAYLPAIERITPVKAVRMVATVVGVSDDEVQEIQQIIGRHAGLSIKKLYDQDWHLGRLYKRSIAVRDLLTRAALLEDLPSGFIKSRRSLALSPVPLTGFLGHSIDQETGDLFVQAGRDGFPIERVFRIDVTSLGALGVTARADEELRNTKIADYGWDGFSINDGEVWNQVQTGETTGVFLFEGPATLQQRETFQLGSIDDLTNFLALMRVREGDQSLSQRFSSYQTRNLEFKEDIPELVPILRGTRGHILYHEQLRDIISVLAGMPRLDAWKMVNELRTATPGVLSAVRKQFMTGTADANLPMEKANEWFERLLYHSKTTMSRKRVFADALLVYKLFFLKTHHESVFYLALLESYCDNEGRLSRYVSYLRDRGLLLDLDVNRSDVRFGLENGKIRVGLCAVPGMDGEVAERIVKARRRGEYRSLEEFVRKVGAKNISREHVRKLIDSGAFDFDEMTRSELLKLLPRVFETRKTAAKPKGEGQLELPFE